MTKEEAIEKARLVMADLGRCTYSDGEADGFLSRNDPEDLIQLLLALIEQPADTLEQAADEFDRRAMLPTISPGFEQARVMACGQWLRDMAYELRNPRDR